MLSANNCRTERGREAPRACRMAISRVRADERATSRLARFTATDQQHETDRGE